MDPSVILVLLGLGGLLVYTLLYGLIRAVERYEIRRLRTRRPASLVRATEHDETRGFSRPINTEDGTLGASFTPHEGRRPGHESIRHPN